MRLVLKLLMISIVGVLFTSCAPKHADIIVANYGGSEITLGEFEKAYAKNVGGKEIAEKDSVLNYKNFLDLYVNYKMKLRDAYIRDYQNDEELIAELNEYKEQVGVSYIEEKQIVTPGMRKFYDERREEVRVSHIMFKAVPNSDEDEKMAQAILDSIKSGSSFEEMVVKHSQDSFSKQNKGDIYWFTAGQIIPSFESAAYATKVGEIYPELVKTKFGYHILKVTDRQPRKYKVRAKHILVKLDEARGNMVDAIPGEKPFAKVTKIYEEIKNGADFDSLARKYSDDPGSGAKGGDLGFFERRQMVQPFDEAVFDLEVNGISEIVTTRFGYHIIQLTEVMEYPTFENEIDNIRDLYKKARYQFDYDNYINSCKDEVKFSLNSQLLNKLSVKDEEITLAEDYTENPKYIEFKDSELITTSTANYNVESFFDYLNSQSKYENKPLTETLLNEGAKEFSNDILLKSKSRMLEKTDPEFANLMADYKSGIYIFKLQEEEVWNKVNIDSTKLREIYNGTKENYTVEGQVNFNEIFSRKKEKIEQYYQMLKDGVEFDSVAFKYTERPGFKAKYGRHGFVKVSENELSKRASSLTKESDYSEIFATDGGWAIVILRKKVAPRIKTFEEALPELSSSFQESESKRLEKEYLDGLKNLYQPEYFYDKLDNAYKVEN